MSTSFAEIAQQRTVRLIPSAYYKPPVLKALVDNDSELDAVAKIEGLTCRRLTSNLPSVDTDGWGRTYIDAAFAYRRKGGNRFNDDTRGAWYAGFEDRTSLTEVAFHKTRELANIDYFYDDTHYRAIHASFIGRFHDLRPASPAQDCLSPYIAVGYPAGQQLARDLISQGSRGLIYPSVRHTGGTCIVSFQKNVIQDVAPGAAWRIVWSGSPVWTATAP
jgi:hypothetical protein